MRDAPVLSTDQRHTCDAWAEPADQRLLRVTYALLWLQVSRILLVYTSLYLGL